jgi:general secretion pathway protein N
MAARTMSKALLSCVAAVTILTVQPSQSAGLDRPGLVATLEKTPAIELTPATKAVDEPEAPPARNADPLASRGNPLWAIPVRALAATRDRPLFSASRRPPPPVIPEAPDPAPHPMPVAIKAAEPERPPVVLVGTIVSADARIAVLLNQTTKLVVQVREGDAESGWRVKAVSPRSTVMERGDKTVALEFPRSDN